MGTKQKPGQFDCYAKALPNEPMFVLLARDPNAPGLVRKWAVDREVDIQCGLRPESDRAIVEEAKGCARSMEVWRDANNGRWRKQEPQPLTREQTIERLTWMATAPAGAEIPEWMRKDRSWAADIREVAAAALALIAAPPSPLNPDTLKAMVFTDRYEDEPVGTTRWSSPRDVTGWTPDPTAGSVAFDARRGTPFESDPFTRAADAERGTPIEEEPSLAMRAAAMAMQAGVPLEEPIKDPDPLATARSLVQQADYGRTSQAGAMAEWLIDPQGMAERQQQAGVPLEEDATAGTRLGRPPLSPSSLLLPEVKP